MEIPKFETDLNIISKLGEYPGSDDGLSTEEFKAKFDEGNLETQKYINEVLIPFFDRGKAETALYKAVFPAENWGSEFPYTNTVPVDGLLEADTPIVDIDLSDDSNAAILIDSWARVGRVVATEGAVTAYCYTDVPLVDIPIQLKVVR